MRLPEYSGRLWGMARRWVRFFVLTIGRLTATKSRLMLPMFGSNPLNLGSNLNRTCLNRYLRCGSAGFGWVRFGVRPSASCSERVRTSVHAFEPVGTHSSSSFLGLLAQCTRAGFGMAEGKQLGLYLDDLP